MPAIDLDSVTASYPGSHHPALRDASLQADDEIVALLGPNGSGKTTLIRVLVGIHTPDSGRCLAPSRRGDCSVVFQTPAVDDLLTVRENLRLAAALHAIPRRAVHKRIESLAPRLGLVGILDTRCARLSGGQRRRADLARALMPTPRVLVLDEPTNGLDIDSRAQFWQTLVAVRQIERLTVLVTTHLAEEADRCDRAVLLAHGSIIAQGTPDELRAPLGNRAVRIDIRPGHDDRPVRDWLSSADISARWWSAGAIVPNTNPDLFHTCPLDAATLRVSAPTLEDAYLWHTSQGHSECVAGT